MAFAYMTTVLIFGTTLSQNWDHNDISKLNQIEEDSGQLLDTECVQFPLSRLALKRQVDLMNFSNEDKTLTKGRLFLIYFANFHPLFGLKHRFDASISRYDRFMMYFAQMVLVAFLCFIVLRNSDMPDLNTGRFDFTPDILIAPVLTSVILSLLLC